MKQPYIQNAEQNSSNASLVTPLAEEYFLKPPDLEMEENMMSLDGSIETFLPHTGAKIIQFIGSIESEGTSTIVREYARVSALKFNKTVLIIDADEKKTSQLEYFGIKTKCGLTDSYKKNENFSSALHQIAGVPLFVSALFGTSSPANLIFNTLSTHGFWESLRNSFDLILVDSPSAITSPDGITISRKVDGVVLVLEAEKTRWPVAVNTKEKILKNGGKFIGMVLNKKKHHIPEFIYKNL